MASGGDSQRAAGIHASEISKCQRLLTYAIKGEERRSVKAENADVNMRMRFELGHAVHAMLQSDFHCMCERFNGALTFEDEVRISPALGGTAAQYNMHSSCDGVFTFFSEGQPYLRVGVEFKTKSDGQYTKMVKPDEDHLEQTCLYQKTLDVPLMWLFYYNKSNSNWTSSEPPYLFQFDAYLWDKKLEPRFTAAIATVQAGGPLPPKQEGMQCGWCPFAWTCQPTRQRARYGVPSITVDRPGALRVIR